VIVTEIAQVTAAIQVVPITIWAACGLEIFRKSSNTAAISCAVRRIC